MKIHPYYYSWRKRAFDVVGAVVLLALSLPVLVIISILILVTSGSPIIFTQARLGKDKKPFILYKFRTMRPGAARERKKLLKLNEAPAPMFKMENDPRFTGIGKWLSNFGLDEVPQFWNILKGEMSFVGPRPLPIDEAQQLSRDWDFRYLVRPGIFSVWALSPKRYNSLKAWILLDQQLLKNGSLEYDAQAITSTLLSLLHKAFITIFLQRNSLLTTKQKL